jgi:hypothetical protein
MRLSFFLLLLAFPFLLLAQTTKTQSSGWGVEVYPHLANNRLIAGGNIGFMEARRRDSLEVADFGYAAGVFYALRGEKIGYHFGLRYLVTGYETQRGPLDNDPFLPATFDYSEKFRAQYLELPFYVNFYQNISEKTSFFFTLGAAANIHLNSKIERTIYDPLGSVTGDFTPEGTVYRTVNFAMLSAIGIETTFNEKITFGFEPNFEYWLGGNVVESADFLTRNFYNIGLRMYVVL